MKNSVTRRSFMGGGASLSALVLTGCTTTSETTAAAPPAIDPVHLKMYAAMPEERFPIPAVDLGKIDPVYLRRVVDDPTGERAGSVVVDTGARFLYLVRGDGNAIRYGVGIGRAGFSWSGGVPR